MRGKQVRQREQAARDVMDEYISTLIRECSADDEKWGCPSCRAAYEHATQYRDRLSRRDAR